MRAPTIAADTPVGGEADYSRATFSVFSATEGPSAGVTKMTAPDGTISAGWRGDDRILFHTKSHGGADEPTNDSVLQECTLAGRCRAVARVDDAWAVVGEQS